MGVANITDKQSEKAFDCPFLAVTMGSGIIANCFEPVHEHANQTPVACAAAYSVSYWIA
ncbi:hypothetical protein SAMN06265218_11248 [Fodinibius sediminis]|uniref:Uncharacterized protein n=1 Tax=Fodinibius sediminis TaxID=1214077 RepID=A0A521DXN9_9BACT|nr:hypothetical protein SAMN06265218_11248 [Fodinibius sediminis]